VDWIGIEPEIFSCRDFSVILASSAVGKVAVPFICAMTGDNPKVKPTKTPKTAMLDAVSMLVYRPHFFSMLSFCALPNLNFVKYVAW
jgi:hypothetical protein